SNDIAAVLKNVRGAVNVVADPIRGKGYLEILPNRDKANQAGVSIDSINQVIEIAHGGRVVTKTVAGPERQSGRVRFARNWRIDEESAAQLPIPRPEGRPPVPLATVADIRIVEGPATIKGENGLLRNYVRLNVSGRDSSDFVEEARRTVAA